MRTMCSREIFTKKCWQQQILDSDLKGAWHYNHVTFTPIAKNFMLYCRLIYMLSILCVILTIKVKVGIPESFKVGWYPLRKTGSSHLKSFLLCRYKMFYTCYLFYVLHKLCVYFTKKGPVRLKFPNLESVTISFAFKNPPIHSFSFIHSK